VNVRNDNQGSWFSFRLSELDVVELGRPAPPLLVQLAFSGVLILVALGLRAGINMFAPGAGPFALTVPAVLTATLFGRWQAGVVCQTLLGLHAWYYVLPATGSWDFEVDSDAARVVVNMTAGYLVVALAEVFRRAVRQAVRERELFLHELEHRVKNSFAQISAMLRLQQTSSEDPAVKEALGVAYGRINSFAEAYRILSMNSADIGTVDLGGYLDRLADLLGRTTPNADKVRFEVEADRVMVSRELATLLGLLVNEVVTNSIKHAFPDDDGKVRIALAKDGDMLRLQVGDDGCGMKGERDGSLGTKLIDGLVRQIHGELNIDTSSRGTTYHFRFPRDGSA
jgi:two-component sensor histidine kinase